MDTTSGNRKKWYRSELFLWRLLPALLTLIAAALALYFFLQYRTVQKEHLTPEISLNAAEALIEQVGKHFLLPEGEFPTIATVSDPNQLEGQLFFEKAEIGDRVLVYTKSKKAILYRPSTDKIVEVMPFEIPEE